MTTGVSGRTALTFPDITIVSPFSYVLAEVVTVSNSSPANTIFGKKIQNNEKNIKITIIFTW